MAGISAPGIGSGLDVNSIVSQLMEVESQPLRRLDQKEAGYQAEISSYGTLKSALSSLQSSLEGLTDGDTFRATKGSSSDENVLSVSTDPDAVPSVYDVTVDRLAQRHKLGSSEFASTDTFGGGAGDSLTITVGSNSFTVDLSSAMTLDQIQAAINDEANTTGVTAGLITGDSGNQTLVLTADQSGYDNRVQVSFGGAIDATTFGFSTLNRDANGQLLASDTELDASLTVDGVTVTRGSNSISDVVSGVTFDLTGVGHSVATIKDDPSVATAALKDFINSYNELKDQLTSLEEGALNGSSLVRGVETRLRAVINQPQSGSGQYSYLSELGVTTNKDTGKLELDEEMLDAALQDYPDSVATFFSDQDNGFAVRMDGVLDGFLASDGMIDSTIDGVNNSIDRLGDQRESLQRRLDAIEKRYRDQFTSLDTLMAQMSTTSDYLTQQLDSLASMWKNNN